MPRRDFASLHLLPPRPCCQLDPLLLSLVASSPPARPAEHHQELTPSHWSHFRRWEQMKTKRNPNAAPALLVLPPASPKTARPPSAPFSCPNGQERREGMSLQLGELGPGWKPPSDPAQRLEFALALEPLLSHVRTPATTHLQHLEMKKKKNLLVCSAYLLCNTQFYQLFV